MNETPSNDSLLAPAVAERNGILKVSVLMPMRNPGRFLIPAVRSVVEQSHSNLELIVIDDGSTDGSCERVSAIGDQRIRLIDGPNAGISACLNTGLSHVTGSVVMRCDADDLYPPGRIACQVDWLLRHPDFIAVCGAFSMIAPDGTPVASPFGDMTDELTDAASLILSGQLKTHLCTFAIHSNIVERIGNFRTFFETAEDIDFALRLAEGGPIGFEPRNAYEYRLHDASITHTQVSARRRFFEEVAYEMSRDRQSTGSDALMRGTPPVPPIADVAGQRSEDARLHMAQLLVGESWKAFRRGDRLSACRAALRAIAARPGHRDAWKALLLVGIKTRRPSRGG